jgi:hypothetical protein
MKGSAKLSVGSPQSCPLWLADACLNSRALTGRDISLDSFNVSLYAQDKYGDIIQYLELN